MPPLEGICCPDPCCPREEAILTAGEGIRRVGDDGMLVVTWLPYGLVLGILSYDIGLFGTHYYSDRARLGLGYDRERMSKKRGVVVVVVEFDKFLLYIPSLCCYDDKCNTLPRHLSEQNSCL